MPGGIFAPSLAGGAGGLPLGLVVILGMVAYFTGVVQPP